MGKFARILAIAGFLLGIVVAQMPLASAAPTPTNGEVTKVNPEQGKITLRHGPIKNLDMDSMTMVFTVADPAMLRSVKPGDQVIFEADRVDGRLTVVKISKAKR